MRADLRAERQGHLAAVGKAEAQALREAAAERARMEGRREPRQRRDLVRASEIVRASEVARAAPPARAAEPEEDGRQDAAAYGQRVAARIASLKRYPEDARARGAQGIAVVSFALDAGGDVRSAGISRSSGDAALDAEAVATVHRAGSFGPPPPGAPRSFSVPLRYSVR